MQRGDGEMEKEQETTLQGLKEFVENLEEGQLLVLHLEEGEPHGT